MLLLVSALLLLATPGQQGAPAAPKPGDGGPSPADTRFYAVAYVAPRSEKVVTVGLATNLIRGDIFYWGSLMAGSLVVGLPIALLYTVVLDQFIEGLTGVGTSS